MTRVIPRLTTRQIKRAVSSAVAEHFASLKYTKLIGLPAFYSLLAVHHAMRSKDVRQAISNYSVSVKAGIIWASSRAASSASSSTAPMDG